MTVAVPAADWRRSAACATADPDLFIGPDGESPAGRARREAKAKQFCAVCPLLTRRACLDNAQRMGDKYGVWGGLGEDERRNLNRRTRRAPRTTTEPEEELAS